jgi:hypothetical protein
MPSTHPYLSRRAGPPSPLQLLPQQQLGPQQQQPPVGPQALHLSGHLLLSLQQQIAAVDPGDAATQVRQQMGSTYS